MMHEMILAFLSVLSGAAAWKLWACDRYFAAIIIVLAAALVIVSLANLWGLDVQYW